MTRQHWTGLNRRLCNFVLAEYERATSKGDILEVLPKITADHVMPQSRIGDWKTQVSEEDHAEYLHTWANLVPLSGGANSLKGCKSWAETQRLLANETVFSTTKHLLADSEVWGISQIQERAETLSIWAVNRWPK